MTSTALTLHRIEGEPRVLDTDIAVRLGMPTPRNIRKDLIEPNREELSAFGSLGETPTNPGTKGGRPGRVFYLNEEQATLVVMFSRTPKAAEARREIIAVFTAWRRGELEQASKPGLPDFSNPALAARAWADEYETEPLREALKLLRGRRALMLGSPPLGHRSQLQRVFCIGAGERCRGLLGGLLGRLSGLGVGFEEGHHPTLKSAKVCTFADPRDLHVKRRAAVAAPTVPLDPRLELPVANQPLRSDQRVSGPLGLQEHGAGVEGDLPVSVVDLGGQEGEVATPPPPSPSPRAAGSPGPTAARSPRASRSATTTFSGTWTPSWPAPQIWGTNGFRQLRPITKPPTSSRATSR